MPFHRRTVIFDSPLYQNIPEFFNQSDDKKIMTLLLNEIQEITKKRSSAYDRCFSKYIGAL